MLRPDGSFGHQKQARLVFGSEHGAMSAWEAVQRGLS
jgi:hypothetical protein